MAFAADTHLLGTPSAPALGVEGGHVNIRGVAPRVAAPTIVVVEDDPALRTFYRSALMIAGYDVIAVEDGIDALRQVERAEPDLVLLDMELPRLHGRDVKDESRRDAPYSDSGDHWFRHTRAHG